MQLARHSIDKLETYGIQNERLGAWREALEKGETFLDVSSGTTGSVFWWEGRSWVVIFSQIRCRDVTTYATDQRTVTNSRGGGRWIFPSI